MSYQNHIKIISKSYQILINILSNSDQCPIKFLSTLLEGTLFEGTLLEGTLQEVGYFLATIGPKTKLGLETVLVSFSTCIEGIPIKILSTFISKSYQNPIMFLSISVAILAQAAVLKGRT